MYCGRCGREVFYAECKTACNKVYHSFCFSCYRCRKLLDSCSVNTLCGELYCNSCYKCLCYACNNCPPSSCLPKPCFENCCQNKEQCCKESCCNKNCCEKQSCCEQPCCKSNCCDKQSCCEESCCKTSCCENHCDPCCKPIRCVSYRNPCCSCCDKPIPICCPKPENFHLRPSCPIKSCNSKDICLNEIELPTSMARCRSCSPSYCIKICQPPKCCQKVCPKSASACAAPSPREVSNYYNRNHDKCPDNCKGNCYCPDDCCCCAKACKSCPVNCCPKPKCNSCCNQPYCPPSRKPVCYPPAKCCNDPCCSPKERICYYPRPAPRQSPCCTCGLPNPCNCDLNLRRRCAIECNTPRCRRCGNKVYPAEKINAACGAFHTCCFSCFCCHKFLEVTNVFECQGEIYCKKCYSLHFGPRGYGYGCALQSHI